jgi:hypothetical protein
MTSKIHAVAMIVNANTFFLQIFYPTFLKKESEAYSITIRLSVRLSVCTQLIPFEPADRFS